MLAFDLNSLLHDALRDGRPATKKKEDKGFFGNFVAQIAENAGGVVSPATAAELQRRADEAQAPGHGSGWG